MIHLPLRHKKIYAQPMAHETFNSYFGERADSRSKLYWLDIDVTFGDITRQQQIIPTYFIARRRPSSPQYSVLHGVGTVANALSVGDQATTFDRFHVDVAALLQSEENLGVPELHRSARMVWNNVDVRSPRLQIYVQAKMLRHLVELYVTKRIDTVIMSMKIAVERQAIVDARLDSELLPVLDDDGRLYFRRTQCELLSVQASLAGERARTPPRR
jgi:hypothetical protein